ncbi:pilus assembly FimT family protein [Duganella guangzhouensis]|uniref:pilus assembly FimT family protein n=1 Tax=Duganella guangzhouensis TaxID=2666084 RepID=UPI0018A1FF33
MSSPSFRPLQAGFTIVELVTVIIVMGILGAVAVGRFHDNTTFDNRAYADQAKTIIRYAQKLAIAQNRNIFVQSNGNSFAVCSGAACGGSEVIATPAGTNSGSSATKTYCQQAGGYAALWMCEGRPSTVTVSSNTSRPEFGSGGYFFFDAMGRPYNRDGTDMASMVLTFASGGNSLRLTIEAETGYAHY